MTPLRRPTPAISSCFVFADRSDRTTQYLAELGLAPAPPNAALLTELIQRHQRRLAFTSIGPQLEADLPLDPNAVFDRVIVQRRGGYCFEHNLLLFDALRELGYACRLLMARVILRTDDAPLDHRVTLVSLPEGDVIADVGMGWPAPFVPVPMNGEPVGNDWRSFRVRELQPGHWTMQSSRGEDWRPLYRFELHEYSDVDCETAHEQTRRSHDSQFVQHLIASLSTPDEIHSLRDATYQVIRANGIVNRDLQDAAELHELLNTRFDVHVGQAEAVRLWELVLSRQT